MSILSKALLFAALPMQRNTKRLHWQSGRHTSRGVSGLFHHDRDLNVERMADVLFVDRVAGAEQRYRAFLFDQ